MAIDRARVRGWFATVPGLTKRPTTLRMRSDSDASPSGNVLLAFLAALAAAAAVSGAVSAWLHPVHVDVGFFLETARRVLDGERLYVDILEPNPPLVVYLMAVPVAIAGGAGGGAVALYRIAAVAATAACAAAGWWMGRRYLPPFVTPFLVAGVACAALVIDPAEFGQRDGMMFVLVFPYLVAAGSRRARVAIPRPLAALVGLAAGIGIALKPFFLIALLAVEASVLAARGLRGTARTEALVAWAFLVAYGAWVAASHGEYLGVAALATQHYGDFAPGSRAELAFGGLVIGLIAAWAFLLAWPTAVSRPLAPVLFAVCLALIASVVIQGKGFPYHWIPAYLAAVATFALAAGVTLAPRRSTPRALPALLLTGALGFFAWRASGSADAAWREMDEYPYYFSALSEVVATVAPGESVFSFWVAPGFPLVTYTSATWGSSFSSHWLLPSMYQDQLRGEDTSRTRRLALDIIARDLARHRPGLLLLDTEPRYNNLLGFDFLDFMMSDPAVAARLEEYRELSRVGEFLILVRSDLPRSP